MRKSGAFCRSISRIWTTLVLSAIAFQVHAQDPYELLPSYVKAGSSPACKDDRSRKFLLPAGFGGVTSTKAYIYKSVQDAMSSGRTLLLPVVRERPHRKPGVRRGASGVMSLSEVYDDEHFCKTVSQMGVCVRCEHFPTEFFDSLSIYSNFEEKYEYASANYSAQGHGLGGRCNTAVSLQRCLEGNQHPFILSGGGLPAKYGTSYGEEFMMFAIEAFKPVDRISKLAHRIRESFQGKPFMAVHMRIDQHYQD
eukprot:4340291-Pyramimonas_sp.AAC.1